MRFIKGFLVGGILVGGLAFGAGYNHGRGAPIVSNPFGEQTLAERVQEAKDEGAEVGEEIEDFIDQATDN